MQREANTPPIELIGASAGTGKTYRLASAFVDAVLGTSGAPIHPSKVLAVTFTNKAADELLERVRQFLIERGEWEQAQLVGSAYIGTVNAVCGRLLKEHALDAGLSPIMNIIPAEEVSNILAVAADRAIDAAADEIEDLAYRLSYEDWRNLVKEITAFARSNAISASHFADCAKKSWVSMKRLLPAPLGLEPDKLDDSLSNAIAAAIEKVESMTDGTKATLNVLTLLKEKRSVLRSGRLLAWNEWAQLTKLAPGKACRPIVQPVIDCADKHAQHPRLHSDIEQLIDAIFKCSASALEQYETYKKEHGFVDFTDQEYLLLKLLDEPRIQQSISERIEIALVDEFQDTSPIQLAIFSKLSDLVRHSIWVGDEKQAIYGFRGTDPELMRGVISNIYGEQGKREQLETSYRSRPTLVQFTNNLFGMSFPTVGITLEHVHISKCARAEHIDQNNALIVCRVEGKNSMDTPISIADFISDALENSGDWQICDKTSGAVRNVIGQDIAVLCRTNEHCKLVAEALTNKRIKVAFERQGLLETSECILAFAALRYLIDRNDSLAMAEIIHLSQEDEQQYQWLNDWLTATDREEFRGSSPALKALDEARTRLMYLTPIEALETAITEAGVPALVKRWGNGRARLSNLDALRGLAVRFEDVCMAQRRAATPAGLVAFMAREVGGGGEQPASLDRDAVQVMTYHGSKGLEFPMVILLDLDTPNTPSAFGVFAETEGNMVNAKAPLQDRWIRFWPWPYGQQRKNVHLDETASICAEMGAIRERDRAENMRLLYVGTSRARDYLVLGCSKGTGWLDGLTDTAGTQLLDLPCLAGEHNISLGTESHRVLVDVRIASGTPQPLMRNKQELCFETPKIESPVSFAPMRSQPSALIAREAASAQDIGILKVHQLGSRLPLVGTPDMSVVGDVFHAFLAADPGRSQSALLRTELATRLLSNWNLKGLEPAALIEANDRLEQFIENTFPSATVIKECPVFGNISGQRFHGRIDLFIQTPNGVVIVDHKTFPGAFDSWIARAASYTSQLSIYADLACKSSGLPLLHLLVHLPVVGALVDITQLRTEHSNA